MQGSKTRHVEEATLRREDERKGKDVVTGQQNTEQGSQHSRMHFQYPLGEIYMDGRT